MDKKFRTYELAKSFYKECAQLKLPGVLNDQFQRASLSVLLNISEGAAKPTTKDRRRFYFISYGSLRETMTLLDISGKNALIKKADILAAHLYRLAQNPRGKS